MARITEIENHIIYPQFHDFNATFVARYHGQAIQGRSVIVVKTDDGLKGLGETWGPTTDIEPLRQRFIGTDPFDWLNSDASLPMNMATYDLMGKKWGVPAWKLMGAKVRSWIPVAAWTVSRPPEDMAEEVTQAARRGYRWIKYHVDKVQNVVDQAAAMQEVAPPGFKVHFDFNANLDFYTICPILLELERFPVSSRFEDVIDDVFKNVSGISTAVEQQAATTRDMAHNISQAAQRVQQVTASVGEVATISTGIATRIASVNSASNDVNQVIERVNHQALELSRMNDEFKKMVEQFKLE